MNLETWFVLTVAGAFLLLGNRRLAAGMGRACIIASRIWKT